MDLYVLGLPIIEVERHRTGKAVGGGHGEQIRHLVVAERGAVGRGHRVFIIDGTDTGKRMQLWEVGTATGRMPSSDAPR